MLLVAILAILGNQGSLLGMERFARSQCKILNALLATHVAQSPSQPPSLVGRPHACCVNVVATVAESSLR
jgi:hypothetical protein